MADVNWTTLFIQVSDNATRNALEYCMGRKISQYQTPRQTVTKI